MICYNKRNILVLFLLLSCLFVGPYVFFVKDGIFSICLKYSVVFFIPFFLFFLYLKKKNKICFRFQNKLFVFLIGASFVASSLSWIRLTFPVQNADLTVMTLKMPVDGFVHFFILDYIKKILLPLLFFSIIFYLPFSVTLNLLECKKVFTSFLCLVVLALSIIPFIRIFDGSNVSVYKTIFFENENVNDNVFLTNHYVAYEKNKVSFVGEEKYNLILIFFESLENSFIEYMPEVKDLYNQSFVFSEGDEFGGGYDLLGTGMTIAGQISKTMGLPLLCGTSFVNSVAQSDYIFFQKQKSIYDILHDYDYVNYYIQGTDSKFAATNSFFVNHGIDSVYDEFNINHLIDVTNEKNVNRFGFSDRLVFDAAKSLLKNIPSKNFSLTLTTIDSHYPYGFEDEKCNIELLDNSEIEKFKKALKCSSFELGKFINWVKKQPFGPNTEIVVLGDHLFMGRYLVDGAYNQNRRFIDLFVNPALKTTRKKRAFSSFDLFPTILESMNFNIEGHKLGLGVSLFYTDSTLVELMGVDSLNSVLREMSGSRDYHAIF